jgi:hypothetical protein
MRERVQIVQNVQVVQIVYELTDDNGVVILITV